MTPEHADFVMRRSAELYPKLCERYAEVKKLLQIVMDDYSGLAREYPETDPILERVWEILDEDREPSE